MQRPLWPRSPRSPGGFLIAVLFAAVMAIRCGEDRNQDLTEESRDIVAAGEATEADRAAIREISAGWLQATRDRQAGRVAAYFAPDAIVFQSGRTPVVGRESIRGDIERDWAVNPDFTIEWQSSSLSVAGSGDMAWSRYSATAFWSWAVSSSLMESVPPPSVTAPVAINEGAVGLASSIATANVPPVAS